MALSEVGSVISALVLALAALIEEPSPSSLRFSPNSVWLFKSICESSAYLLPVPSYWIVNSGLELSFTDLCVLPSCLLWPC